MMRIRIENMHCGGCARSVTAVIRGTAPGVEVQVDLEACEVKLLGAPVPGIIPALLDAGWKASEVAS